MTRQKLVLVDFGGVLLKLRDPQAAFEMAVDAATFNEKWLLSESVRELECGQCAIDEFAVSAVAEFGLPYSESNQIKFEEEMSEN